MVRFPAGNLVASAIPSSYALKSAAALAGRYEVERPGRREIAKARPALGEYANTNKTEHFAEAFKHAVGWLRTYAKPSPDDIMATTDLQAFERRVPGTTALFRRTRNVTARLTFRVARVWRICARWRLPALREAAYLDASFVGRMVATTRFAVAVTVFFEAV